MNFGKWLRIGCVALAIAIPSGAGADKGEPLQALLALNTSHYTGGLTREDRAVADAIHNSLSSRYTAVCPVPDAALGEDDDQADKPAPPPLTDPDLKALVDALDNPRQEVRDTAAYTIGMLGPSANAALPALSAKAFGDYKGLGGWFNSALAAVSCQNIVAADFRKTIPAQLFPPENPWPTFLAASSVVLAKLYLDPDVEYPPDMMGYAYSNYGLPSSAQAAVPLLAQILDDDRLGHQKQLEAAEALARISSDDARPAQRALERAVQSSNPELRRYAAQALIGLHDEAAIPAIIESIGSQEWWGDWSSELCLYKHAALSAENRLLQLVAQSRSPRDVRAAVRALGCIGSAKAVAVLAPLLSKPDWLLNLTAAKAIGEIGTNDPAVRAYLQKLAVSHWSSKVRNAAHDALFPRPPSPPPSKSSGVETVIIGGEPGPIDHGLPWCDERGRYSIDSHSWFYVKWIESSLQPVPPAFRGHHLIQGVGTQVFVRVADGWLMGSDGFESEGVFVHVSEDGSVQNLQSDDTTIKNIVKVGGRYFAFGYQLLTVGEIGSLFEIDPPSGGKWTATRVLALPGVPYSYAVSPDGHLLLSDGPNDYAIVDGQIAPLKCEKTYPGRYFDKYPEDDFMLNND